MSFFIGVTRRIGSKLMNSVYYCIRQYSLMANIIIVRYFGTCKYFCLYIVIPVFSLFLINTPTSKAQNLALKTNMLYDVLSVPSLGCEVAVAKHFSAGIMCTYNPIKYGDKKWKNFSFQPELKYWFHRKYTGPFVGVNMITGGFNVDNIHAYGLYGKHRQGHFVGGGVSVGYNLILSNRFSMEFALGADYVHAKFERFREGDLPYKEGDFSGNTVLPTGTGVTLVYIINKIKN